VTDPDNPEKQPRKKRHLLLKIDSWIDSTIWNAGFRSAEIWEDITIFFRRFRVRGWKRVVFELAGEGLTWGSVGAVLMLALAQPAFEATKEDWRNRGDYAVTFLDRYGNVIGHRGVIHQNSVPIDELPDSLIKSVLATEDRRFFSHFGIDVIGLFRAIVTNAQAGGVVQGGSTLTQQLAKNLFLSNERSIDRKITEAFLALWLEANLSKKEILSTYLDRAYMGGGTFGAAAAAQFYFGKNITDVNLAESAMLAGLFKAPAKYAPHVNLPAARGRANEVLTNLVQSGMMTEGQVIAARRSPATVVDRNQVESPDFFLDWAFDETMRLSPRFHQHSLIVRTTVDMGLQHAAEDSMETSLREYGESYHAKQGAMVMIENGGAVRAMVGGRDYGESQFNRATKALRQPGSSFKVYTYSVAMENGMTPDSIVVDAPISWGNWSPHNYENRYAGRITIATAVAQSINTIPVRLAKEKFGIAPIRAMATNLGVESPVRNDVTIPIGTSEVTVMDQATAYAVAAPRHHPDPRLRRRRSLRFRQGRAAGQACALRAGRRLYEPDAVARALCRHRKARRPRQRHPDSRQDRHDAGLSRRLVHRLHRQFHHRRLVRQRRLHLDQQDDRRHASGHDLQAPDGLRPPGHHLARHPRRHRPPAPQDHRRHQTRRRRATTAGPPTDALGGIDEVAEGYRRGTEDGSTAGGSEGG